MPSLSRLAWLRPRFACSASCFVAGFCRKTVTHFSGTCLAGTLAKSELGSPLPSALRTRNLSRRRKSIQGRHRAYRQTRRGDHQNLHRQGGRRRSARSRSLRDLMGRLGFTEYFHLLLTGHEPTENQRYFLDLLLIAIAEHGMMPTVQAARMTLAADPRSLQGALAAGLLGCGPVLARNVRTVRQASDAGARQDCGRRRCGCRCFGTGAGHSQCRREGAGFRTSGASSGRPARRTDSCSLPICAMSAAPMWTWRGASATRSPKFGASRWS